MVDNFEIKLIGAYHPEFLLFVKSLEKVLKSGQNSFEKVLRRVLEVIDFFNEAKQEKGLENVFKSAIIILKLNSMKLDSI